MEAKAKEILQGLRSEINSMLFWFVEMDYSQYGYIKQSTVECFKTQGVEFPNVLEDLVEKSDVV